MLGNLAHIVPGEPMDFPEGTVLELTITDPGDDLDDSERAALHRALPAAWASAREGCLQPAEVLLAKLRGAR